MSGGWQTNHFWTLHMSVFVQLMTPTLSKLLNTLLDFLQDPRQSFIWLKNLLKYSLAIFYFIILDFPHYSAVFCNSYLPFHWNTNWERKRRIVLSELIGTRLIWFTILLMKYYWTAGSVQAVHGSECQHREDHHSALRGSTRRSSQDSYQIS